MSGEFCCNCKEDFPVALGPYRMGALRPLYEAPSWVKDRTRSWLDHGDGSYLCGNCYFDWMDDRDDA